MNMVEKVARSMLASLYPAANNDELESHWDHYSDSYLVSARAAIKAMREPTQEMITAEEVHWDYSCHICGGHREGWENMIDAALKEDAVDIANIT